MQSLVAFGTGLAQILASTLAAVSAALAASFLGVAGTIIGAALGSLVATIGSAIYAHSLRTAGSRLQRLRPQGPGTPSPRARVVHGPATAYPGRCHHLPAPLARRQRRSHRRVRPGPYRPDPRRDIPGTPRLQQRHHRHDPQSRRRPRPRPRVRTHPHAQRFHRAGAGHDHARGTRDHAGVDNSNHDGGYRHHERNLDAKQPHDLSADWAVRQAKCAGPCAADQRINASTHPESARHPPALTDRLRSLPGRRCLPGMAQAANRPPSGLPTLPATKASNRVALCRKRTVKARATPLALTRPS